jgi:fatty-acyl-CoA synthase
MRTHLAARLPRWAVPDRILFIDSLPIGATGKDQKSVLRDLYAKSEGGGG